MSHSTADIRRQAAYLLQSAGVSHEPVSLRDVVSTLNLEVVRTSGVPFSCEAALEPVGDGHRIVLHGRSLESRRRFTIAHEIGHFVLHPHRLAPMRNGGLSVSAAWQAEEREADQFAAELLMPEHLVREAVLLHGADIARLAERFQVSRQAMKTRLKWLGLEGHAGELPRARPAF